MLRFESPIKGDFRLSRVRDVGRRGRHPRRRHGDGPQRRRQPRPAPVRGRGRVRRRPPERPPAPGVRASASTRAPVRPLARAEANVSLERLFDRIADIRISESAHGPAGRTTLRVPARRTSSAACAPCTWSSRRSTTRDPAGLRAETGFSFSEIGDIVAGAKRRGRTGGLDAALHQARRGQLDRALSRARHRARCRTRDSISPEFYELEREAIFGRTWLNVGRVEQLPKVGQLLHEGARRGAHVGRRRARHGRRGPRVPQHLPAPRQQARVDRLSRRGDERRVPAVHLQVPRLALRARGRAARSCSRSRSSSTSTRPTTRSRRCSATCGKGSSS